MLNKPAAEQEAPLLEWISFPLVERIFTSALLLVFLVLFNRLLWEIAVVKWAMPLYYYLGMALIIISLLPYFIRTHYQMFSTGFVVHYGPIRIKRQYADFGCFYADKRGIMLSTFKMPRRLDPFRGQSLRFSKTQTEKEALIALLTEKIGKQY
jgi:hypothetical protein